MSGRVVVPRGDCLGAASKCLLRSCAVMLAAISAFLGGCGAARPVKYYELTYATSTVSTPGPIDTTIMVRLFEASHLYVNDRIVYATEGPEMGAYETHRWAQPPVEALQEALVRGLRASGLFRGAYMLRSNANGQFVLGGHLYDFKEVDLKPMVARLSYEVRLRDRLNGTTVWTHTYSHDEAASETTVNAFVTAMDKNVQRSVQEVQTGLEDYFREHPVK